MKGDASGAWEDKVCHVEALLKWVRGVKVAWQSQSGNHAKDGQPQDFKTTIYPISMSNRFSESFLEVDFRAS